METPPPAWGRLTTATKHRRDLRNTPTCVGKTPWRDLSESPHRKHPHLRGEDSLLTHRNSGSLETPPPAWGRLAMRRCNNPAFRNTPTCVGKTHDTTQPQSWHRKHPHLRGEDSRLTSLTNILVETPPPAWGRPLEVTKLRAIWRNTPTCVGKTTALFHTSSAAEKHPHLRGEDTFGRSAKAWITETPPPAWGRPRAFDLSFRPCGNTPTCVGKTRKALSRRRVSEKHPHLRGEDSRSCLALCRH